jgi:hypothetical protein
MDKHDWFALAAATALGMAALVVVIFAVGAAMYPFERRSCDAHWPDIEHRYSFWGDCQVKTASGWIPDENYRESKVVQ